MSVARRFSVTVVVIVFAMAATVLRTSAASRAVSASSVSVGPGSNWCAVLEDGTVHCWGKNWYGSLGIDRVAIGDDEDPTFAVNLGTTERAVQVSVGGFHTCALMADGEVRCFGMNTDGQLGNGRYDPVPVALQNPTPVITGGPKFTSVDAGGWNSCGVDTGGLVRCWGLNYHGVLGQPSLPLTASVPDARTSTPMPNGERAVQVTTSATESCAVLVSGRVACWGANDQGQLGLGFTSAVEPPTLVELGRSDAVQVVEDGYSTCVRFRTGTIRCWGTNRWGQLGIGTTDTIGDNEIPTVDVIAPDAGPARWIAAGGYMFCATYQSGKVRCWGSGGYALGLPGPVRNNSINPYPAETVLDVPATQVESNLDSTCALLSTTGRVRCWGVASRDGMLGVPSLLNTATTTGLDINFGTLTTPEPTTTSTVATVPVIIPVVVASPTTTTIATTTTATTAPPSSSTTTTSMSTTTTTALASRTTTTGTSAPASRNARLRITAARPGTTATLRSKRSSVALRVPSTGEVMFTNIPDGFYTVTWTNRRGQRRQQQVLITNGVTRPVTSDTK